MSMNAEPWPDAVRKAIVWTASIGFGLAVAGFVVRLAGGSLSFLVELPGAVVLGSVMAVPPALAILSTRNRPLMLLPAGVLGLAGMLGVLSIFGIPLAILGLIWLWAYVRLGGPGQYGRKFGMVVVPLLWVAGLVTLFVHQDPRCEQVLADGTVQSVDPYVRGMESGWIWELDTSSFAGGSVAEADVQSEACVSDVVTPVEMVVALAFAGLAVGYAWSLAGPPTHAESPAGVGTSQSR
jgi:hypothetical protein